MKSYEKVDAAVERGEIWRAKEILRGRISNSGYDSQLFERYGVILLRTADTLEAGKFLFLSGVRIEEYKQPVQLFLDRYKEKQIWDALPTRIQKTKKNQWPAIVVDELANLGVNIEQLQSAELDQAEGPTKKRLLTFIALAFLTWILLTFVVGVWMELRTIWGWFF